MIHFFRLDASMRSFSLWIFTNQSSGPSFFLKKKEEKKSVPSLILSDKTKYEENFMIT